MRSLALRVLVLTIALVALLVVVVGIPAIVTTMSERFSGFLANEGSPTTEERGVPPDRSASTQQEYLDQVEEIQTGSVTSFRAIDAEFFRYDSLTSEDVEGMKADYDALGGYLDRAEGLSPPEERKNQHELFRSGITDLYRAAELAYSLASDPASVTTSSLDEYDLLVNRAAFRLEQSNEALDRNFATIQPRE